MYSATNPTSTAHDTGVNRGNSPNRATVTAAASHTAGNCTTAVPTTLGSVPPISPAAIP